MHTRTHSVRLKLTLAAVDYRVFVLAARVLRQVMGRKAPTAEGLIQHSLTERRATTVADDYLEWVDWPRGRFPAASAQRRRTRPPANRLQAPVIRGDDVFDPSRN